MLFIICHMKIWEIVGNNSNFFPRRGSFTKSYFINERWWSSHRSLSMQGWLHCCFPLLPSFPCIFSTVPLVNLSWEWIHYKLTACHAVALCSLWIVGLQRKIIIRKCTVGFYVWCLVHRFSDAKLTSWQFHLSFKYSAINRERTK